MNSPEKNWLGQTIEPKIEVPKNPTPQVFENISSQNLEKNISTKNPNISTQQFSENMLSENLDKNIPNEWSWTLACNFYAYYAFTRQWGMWFLVMFTCFFTFPIVFWFVYIGLTGKAQLYKDLPFQTHTEKMAAITVIQNHGVLGLVFLILMVFLIAFPIIILIGNSY